MGITNIEFLKQEPNHNKDNCKNYDPLHCAVPYLYEHIANEAGRTPGCIPRYENCNLYVEKDDAK